MHWGSHASSTAAGRKLFWCFIGSACELTSPPSLRPSLVCWLHVCCGYTPRRRPGQEFHSRQGEPEYKGTKRMAQVISMTQRVHVPIWTDWHLCYQPACMSASMSACLPLRLLANFALFVLTSSIPSLTPACECTVHHTIPYYTTPHCTTCRHRQRLQVASAVIELQSLLPNARVLYCSATGVSEARIAALALFALPFTAACCGVPRRAGCLFCLLPCSCPSPPTHTHVTMPPLNP